MTLQFRRKTLLQRGTRHLILIFTLMATLLVSTSFVGYEISQRSLAGIELDELLGMYKVKFNEYLQQCEQESIRLRTLIVYTGILGNPERRWERLSEFLNLQENGLHISHIVITDKSGKRLFNFGKSAEILPASSAEHTIPSWYLEKETNTQYRVFRQSVPLANGAAGYILTFHPFTDSLLHSSASLRTHLLLRKDSSIVASSLRSNGATQGPAAIGSGSFVMGSFRLGSDMDAPDLLVYRQFPELFSFTKLTAGVGLCLLLMFSLLWSGIGAWVVTLSRRVSALGSISNRYFGHNGETGNTSTAICHQQPDEISDVATALEQMTAMLEVRDRELSTLALVARETREMVIITDRVGAIEWVNEGFTRQTGYTLQDVKGCKPGHVLQGEKSDRRVAAFMGRRISECRPFTVQLLNYDKAGKTYWVEIKAQPIVNENGKVERYIAVETDITVRKRTQDRLQLLSKVFYLSNEGILITDRSATIIAVNESFCRLTGYSRQEVIGKNPKILKSGREDAAFYSAMWSAIDLQGYWQGEIWDRRKDGSAYPKLLMIFAVKKNGGEIVNYIGSFSDITEQKQAEERIRHQAHHDALTGLPNRFTVLDRLERAIIHGRRNYSAVAVMFIDLDRFKMINDTLGHDVGDDLLIQVAVRLQSQVRESDTVARIGGDEFVIVLPEIADPSSAAHVADKVLQAVGSPFFSGAHTLSTTPSIGIAIFPNDGDDIQTLMKNADAAMYRAKSLGRNNYQYFSEEPCK